MNGTQIKGFNSSIALSKRPGKLEVLEPEDGFFTDTCSLIPRRHNSEELPFTNKHTINHQIGKLQVLGKENKDEAVICPIGTTSRPSSAIRRPGSAEIKCYSPTKQISLCAVKRLSQSGDASSSDHIERLLSTEMNSSGIPSSSTIEPIDKKEDKGSQSQAIQNISIKKEQEESSDEDESGDETGGAPTQLCAEFLKAVMDKDYKLAQKLCQMLLLYEPENPEAKEFSPLIEEMLQIEAQQSDTEDEEDDDDETDEESYSSESSEDSSTGNSEDSSEDESDD
ncbi:Hypothetical predicted protein [Pelobates cultripes]|uniref:Glutamate-rich protein 2 n=1 Tax=Pelobates cultripes TaxID=61616 RepID=A0AAD1WHF0_PELCU|nr:Hypothetical predicted protein [Pelobates cultripes]